MIKAMLCILHKNCILFIILLQIYTSIQVNELVGNSYYLFKKQIQQLLYTQEYLIFYGKSSSDSNLIFIKSFLYLIGLPPLIVPI